MTSFVTDLMVLEGKDTQPPKGWSRIPKDLNAGAGGAYLYFAYERDGAAGPLTDVLFVLGKDAPAPPGYRLLPVDLNKGAGGPYIHACVTRDPGRGEPLTDLDVLLDTDGLAQPPAPWFRIDLDLNKGAKGKFVYLTYQSQGAARGQVRH
ncbi:hypothetical protein [Streptomyces cinnamoneus]|uniref:MABP domain-containing protein n=1 Tax=Streptomyces cinnamoneus TaxID=53446 RepID=A0A918WMR2_STRCJ|nr:hypothetical protein [Streptomyces cinnamoneus]GHC57503.1 hypothetical protein GCM10010507_37690 [Streptomyces cinnamoneus]